MEKSVGQVTEEAYKFYGAYVNTSRSLPRLDGLKVSVARLLYVLINKPKGVWQHSLDAISEMSRYHPHGLDFANLTASHFVRSGVLDGSGSFGYISLSGVKYEPAAPRYTSIKLSDLYCDALKDLVNDEYIKFHESPQGAMEPDYIPFPIPFALFLKIQTTGLGVGIRTQVPSFSPSSLFKAFMKDDPNLLEPSVDLILDKKHSELKKLWTTGKGKVAYCYKISRQKSPDGKSEGIMFESNDMCSSEIFVPKLSKFDTLVETGKVYIEDLTNSEEGLKLFVGRVPGARGITVDDIEKIAKKVCYSSIEYNTWVTDGTQAFRIPIRDWIKFTYERYINLLKSVNEKKIEKVEFNIAVQQALSIISDYIINKNPKATDKEIVKNLGIPEEIVESVMSKPISYLRNNKDTKDRVKGLKNKLKELKSFDPIAFTENLIMKI